MSPTQKLDRATGANLGGFGTFGSLAAKVAAGLVLASILGGVAMFNAHGADITEHAGRIKAIETETGISRGEEHGTRVTVLETRYERIDRDLQEIKTDVKKILEAK